MNFSKNAQRKADMVDREGIAHLRPDFTGFERKPSLGDSEGWGGVGWIVYKYQEVKLEDNLKRSIWLL